MDFKSERHEIDPLPGVRRTHRIIARYGGHTHVYQFTDRDIGLTRRTIKLHVEDEQLHPYAGLILLSMLREIRNGS